MGAARPPGSVRAPRWLAAVSALLVTTGAGALMAMGPAAAGPAAPAELVAVTTTTAVTPTTTTVPPTTTTAPPPTTTEPPTTTSSRPERTTTTSSSTTTTTAPPTTTTSSKTPWALIIVIVVLVLAIVLVVLLLAARRRRGVEAAWRKAVVPALSDAQLARASLLSGNAISDDAEVRGAVAIQVERAAVALEHTVATAPDAEAGGMATTAASGLRGLAFAIEADRLLRQGTAAPSGMQLAQADEARRARSSELTSALVRLSARIGSAPG
jgi:hypothetical protein